MLSKILFVSLDNDFTKWINYYFKNITWIEGKTMNIIDYNPKLNERVAYMSPMNDLGYMESGIDLDYNTKMFKLIQRDVMERLISLAYYFKDKPNKPFELNVKKPYLPIGSAIIVPIKNSEHFLICSPTYCPNKYYKNNSKNCYYSFKAVLKVIIDYCNAFGDKIDTLIIPALCCGSCKIKPKTSAFQVFSAFFDCLMGLDDDNSIYSTPMDYIYSKKN